MALRDGFTSEIVAAVRERFAHVESDPIAGRRIYLENAGGTLKLKTVLSDVAFYTALPDNAGRLAATSRHITEVLNKGREDVALLVGAHSGRIVSEQSGTGMIFRILSTVCRSVRGTNIVTSDLEHPAVYDACHLLARRHGLECRIARLDRSTGVVPTEAVTALVDGGTVLVAIIHASNILGTQNDVAAIVRSTRAVKPDLYIVIDGCQHISHGLADVEAYGADAWIFDAYKVYSKIGTNFAHISERLAHLDRDNLLGKPQEDWDLGTREPAAFSCMSRVVDYVEWLGGHFTDSSDRRTRLVAAMQAVEAYERQLLSALLHGTGGRHGLLGLDGVTIYGGTSDLSHHQAILAFSIEGAAAADVVRFLEQRGIVVHYRRADAYSRHTLEALGIEECVRVSLCHYNTVEEVAALLAALQEYGELRPRSP